MQVVLLQLPLIKDEAQVKTLVKKLGPPLVTLLSEEAEIQYVALRNINLIVQNHPDVLSYEIKVGIPPLLHEAPISCHSHSVHACT